MKKNLSAHSIINGLLSSKPENILETIQILGQIDANGTPSNLLDYLKVSPLCLELLQVWSRYVVESISVKKNKNFIQNGESNERKIVIAALNCISEIIEYYILVYRIRKTEMNQFNEFKENIEKLGMLIISKYKMNIYRHLNSTSKVLISSSLRLLASISGLSKSHKQEILHEFNFSLPSFISISKFFEYKKRERTEFEDFTINPEKNDIFIILFQKRSEIGVRIQYLRFLLSFLDLLSFNSSKQFDSNINEKDIIEFLKIRNISNTIFKNSIQYDSLNISKNLLFAFEHLILENDDIPNTLKGSFFNLTVINYIFTNLVDMLSQIDFKQQLEATDHDLERYARIIERLLRLHINVRTKESVRLIFVWFKSINRQVKYPIVQKLLISIYSDLTLKEKLEYYQSSTLQLNFIGESKLEGILVLAFVSSLIKCITQSEKDDLQKYIIQNILNKNSVSDLEIGVKYLVDWIIPSFINKILLGVAGAGSGGGVKLLNTRENLFLNISNLAILINLSKRLSLITEIIVSNSVESQLKDTGEFLINMIKQIIYQSFPDLGNILSLLRHYFKNGDQKEDHQNHINNFFLKRDHYTNAYDLKQSLRDTNYSSDQNSTSVIGKEYIEHNDHNEDQDEDEDDGMFINIIASKSPNRKDKKIKIEDQSNENEEDISIKYLSVDTKEVERKNFYSNMIIFQYIKACINSKVIIKEQNQDLLKCKFEIIEVIFGAMKTILKSFGNEFLLSMGYKFDNTKLILDQVYRETYLNDEFLANLTILEYKRFFDHYIYKIILYSLNIKGLKYDWNCNKLLLFKFLENLISIIQYYQTNSNQNPRGSIHDTSNCNISFIVKYLTSMWISIVSKLNTSRQNSLFYYLDNINIEKRDDIKIKNSFPTLDLNLLYFQLKLILLVNKTLYNYEILIQGFFQDYIQEGKLSKEFLERNMDLIILLLLVNSLGKHLTKDQQSVENQKYELLINIINFKGILGQFKLDLNSIDKNKLFDFIDINDYIVQVIEKRLRFELLDIQNNNSLDSDIRIKSINTLLGNVFNNWIHKDEVRCKILKGFENNNKKMIKYQVSFMNNMEYYYKLLCETGFQTEFDISEIIFGFIEMSLLLMDKKEEQREELNEIDYMIKMNILELNYYQMCVFNSKYEGNNIKKQVFESFIIFKDDKYSIKIEEFLKGLAIVIRDLGLREGEERVRLLIISFLDIYIKLRINNKLLFNLLFSIDLNIKEIINNGNIEIITDKKQNYSLSGYLIDTILDNITNYELVSLTRELILKDKEEKERIFGFSRIIFLSRLIEKLFQVYTYMMEEEEEKEQKRAEEGVQGRTEREFQEKTQENKNAFEYFTLSFVDLIRIFIDTDILKHYKVRLYSIKNEKKDNYGNGLELNIPIEIFGFRRQFRRNNGLLVRVFMYIMVYLFPYVYLRAEKLEIMGIKDINKNQEVANSEYYRNQLGVMDLESIPIGYKLILILDHLELNKLVVRREKEFFGGQFSLDLELAIIKSATKELIDLFNFYEEFEQNENKEKDKGKEKMEDEKIQEDFDKRIFKKMLKSFKVFPILIGEPQKSKMKFSIENGKIMLRIEDERKMFWEILDLLVFKNQESKKKMSFGCKRRHIMVNSNLIFTFLIDLYSQYKNNREKKEKYNSNDNTLISEIVYLGYLLHYESFKKRKNPSQEDQKMIISILIECYNVILLKFQTLFGIENQLEINHYLRLYYYYIILVPVLMDRLNNPIYYCLRSYLIQLREEKCKEIGLIEKKYLNFILDYDLNESFYELLIQIKEIKEYQNKYPIGFIESSKTFINNSKHILDSYGNNKESDFLLIILLASTLYIAKIKQMRFFQYRKSIYNKLSNFVLLKLNRILVFLNKIHEILFEYLKKDDLSTDNNSRNMIVIFIFIEYLLILKEDGNSSSTNSSDKILDESLIDLEKNQRVNLLISKEYIMDYLKITKIGKFQSDSLYYKILNESKIDRNNEEYFENEDYNINCKEFKSLILANHNIFLVNNKLKETLIGEEDKGGIRQDKDDGERNNINDNEEEARNNRVKERMRLVKYWYHYYSIYLNNNYIDFDNKHISEFNWLNPNLKRLKYTLNDFPYNSKLMKNSDLTFNLNDGRPENDYIYDLGLIIPIINSRFKLAYSILRERGFQNSKNKNLGNDNREENNKELIGDTDNQEVGGDTRTCSGFVKDYGQLSGSRFFNNVIDNNFIWLRNFCKNGSLQLLINSLSCTDISLRYYSYQTLSLLYEIVSFHYNKYLQRLREQEQDEHEREEQEQDEGEQNEQEHDEQEEEEQEQDEQEQDEQEQDEREEDEQEQGEQKQEEKIEVINKKKRNKKQRKKHIRYIFKELPQIFMILNTLKNTVSGTLVNENQEIEIEEKDENSDKMIKETESKHEDCIRLSSFLTRFISDSIEVIFEPENKLFKQINYFILSRPFLDRYDIPMVFNFLYSENANDHYIHKSFIFNELETSIKILRYLKNVKGLELEQEHDSINRRFIFPLLLNYIKTNNIYSQHNYFENTIHILNIILNMINNKESNIIYHNLENIDQDIDLQIKQNLTQDLNLESEMKSMKIINNSLTFSNPNVEILLKDKVNRSISKVNQANNLPSSVTLIIQMINQYSLLDFIRNLIQQISISNYNKLNNNKHFKEMIQLLVNILLVITGNIFNGNYDENYKGGIFYKLKYYNNDNLNKTILKFLGGYSNSYWVFQKLLTCIRLASNPKISKFYDSNMFSNIYYIWFNSYIGLLYCNKYLFKDIENPKLFNELIFDYQEFLSSYFQNLINLN
ncbi:uncharacterized protein cubi_01602 [Cryptosporidium ubiquitum]|uniref:URB1 C-terminal domain-containing protein n=1 Tax=Cryptosporidium ubiquitum TaxID=857276 RepID=A0A1J4MHF5_9CRYT|nr:uncharacterized protein cubi_01602 [Cryptosporidium ubiquitum]OII72269.1 hypothetical protein cubi_01602 [Cryptosporidium ubiquitum]